ncbi:MAG: DMT family transporter, partial [Candidatus Rokubacteria bacterium]|nr:DMT family transporter [Candidatus Rokubacteria bacterium]
IPAHTRPGPPGPTRHPAAPGTARSLALATPALLPAAAAEWVSGRVPTPTPAMALGTLYLAVVITALGYLVWNWGLERVPAARAAVFLNLQPVVGALLGVAVLDEPAGVLTAAGAALVVTGLALTTRRAPT